MAHGEAAVESFRRRGSVRAGPGKSGVLEVEAGSSYTSDTQGHNLVARRSIGSVWSRKRQTEIVCEAGRGALKCNGLLEN